MTPTRRLVPCETPGCKRRLWRKRGEPRTCPRCRAEAVDRERDERIRREREELVSLKRKPLPPDKPTIPEREALILHWMRTG
jgi:hypothetical protein